MKKIHTYAILAVLSFGIFSISLAEENKAITKIQVHDKAGKVRFVTEDPNWREATFEEERAVKSHGKPVAIDYKKIMNERSIFYVSTKLKSEKALVYENGKLKPIYKKTVLPGEKEFFNPVFVLLGVVVLIGITNFLYLLAANVGAFLFFLLSLSVFILNFFFLISFWHFADFILISFYVIGLLLIPWSRGQGKILREKL